MTPMPESNNLDALIEKYLQDGFRLDMLMPADSPREALLSKNGSIVRLHSKKTERDTDDQGWVTGRAGMMYRDLIPDRMDGKMIASHIRITVGGPVSDYVHY